VLAALHPDVKWPNAIEGSMLHGPEAVRAYWLRQWSMIDPHVEPTAMGTDELGRVMVDVHQVVRDLSGKVFLDNKVKHIYVMEDHLVKSMEIR
jgi:hypothetical protein